jgi:hypothetical protein
MARIAVPSGGLSRRIFKGDHVRIKEKKQWPYVHGYPDMDVSRIMTVIIASDYEGRVMVEGAPHLLWKSDCELAWNSPADRQAALLAAGHTL